MRTSKFWVVHWTIHPGHPCWWNHKSDQSQGVPSRPLLLESYNSILQAIYYAVTTFCSAVPLGPSCTKVGLSDLVRLPNKDWVPNKGSGTLNLILFTHNRIKINNFFKKNKLSSKREGTDKDAWRRSSNLCIMVPAILLTWYVILNKPLISASETLVAASIKPGGFTTQ